MLAIFATHQLTTRSDFGDRPLSLSRVRAAMLLALAIGLTHAFTKGDSGVLAMIPLWASLAAVPLYRMAIRLGLMGE